MDSNTHTSGPYVNGKWLAQSPSGTQRYASQVMDSVSRTSLAGQLVLVVPRDATEPPWATEFTVVRSRMRGIVFEQLALPWISRGRHVISMAGPAPLLKRNQTVVMHDAMPFRYPQTFRRAFVAWYWVMYFVLARTARRVLTVSSFSRHELAQTLRVPAERFGLAPCGADHLGRRREQERPAAAPEPFSFALIVGNLAPHKNVEAAASALADAGLPVVVVGAAQQVFRQTEIAQHPNVTVMGRIDDEELDQLYATAGVLVAPSRYEGFGIPIVEAGSRGCPTVFALGSAMTEVAGDAGLGFDPDDIAGCVAEAKRVIGDQELRKSLSQRALQNAKRYTWAHTAQQIFGLPDSPADPPPRSESQALRVLHVTETFSAGTGTAIIEYARAMRDQGVESYLLAQDRGSGLLDEVRDDSPFRDAQILQPGLLTLWRSVQKAVAQWHPDVVHLHSSMAGAVGRLQPPLSGSPVVVYSPHCFAFERRDIPRVQRWAYRMVESLLARRTDAFVCVSPHEAQLAAQFAGNASVHEVLNTFAIQHDLTPAPPDTDGLGLVTVGRVAPQKDPTLFMEIVASLRESAAVSATWVGDGETEFRSQLEAGGVRVTGWLAASEVPSAIGGHTVYVHTAGWEASVPIAVLDAMSIGLPVVVKRNAAYRSILPEAWQFDDSPAACAMIREFIDPDTRRRRIQQQFGLLDDLRLRGPQAVLADAYRHTINGVSGPRNRGSLAAAAQQLEIGAN